MANCTCWQPRWMSRFFGNFFDTHPGSDRVLTTGYAHMGNQPIEVGGGGGWVRGDGDREIGRVWSRRGHRALVDPAMQGTVPVGKGKGGRIVMIGRRQIRPFRIVVA